MLFLVRTKGLITNSTIELATTSATIVNKRFDAMSIVTPPWVINSDGLLQAPLSSVTHQSLLNYITNYSSPEKITRNCHLTLDVLRFLR